MSLGIARDGDIAQKCARLGLFDCSRGSTYSFSLEPGGAPVLDVYVHGKLGSTVSSTLQGVCEQHKRCRCWITTNVHNNELLKAQVLGDIMEWGSCAKYLGEEDHRDLSEALRLKYNMNTRSKRPWLSQLNVFS